MAGHCISGDVVAHSNYRVTGNAAIMGQAYGKVAAIAILANRPEEAIITGVFLLTVFHMKFQRPNYRKPTGYAYGKSIRMSDAGRDHQTKSFTLKRYTVSVLYPGFLF